MNTSTTSIDNKVASIFQAAQAAMSSATPNTGQGAQGEWPPEGDHDCFILSMSVEAGKFKEKGGAECDCAEVQFNFELSPNESDPLYDASKPKLEWRGERFQLVPDFTSKLVTDGGKTRARINWDRFVGHATKILKRSQEECSNAQEVVEAILARINGDTRLAVRVRCQYRQGKGPDGKPTAYVNKTEFILDNLS